MAHPAQMRFARAAAQWIEAYGPLETVLEIGSVNINGSVREFFCKPDTKYLGVDVAPGPGVDCVKPGHLLEEPSESFDAVLSFECFEHNPYWKETFVNMLRMCKPGGGVIISCAGAGRAEHGTDRSSAVNSLSASIGWNYYRNLSHKELLDAVNIDEAFSDYHFALNRADCDLYFVGRKRGGIDQGHRPSCESIFSDGFFDAADKGLRKTLLNVVFSYLEQGGIPNVPYLHWKITGS